MTTNDVEKIGLSAEDYIRLIKIFTLTLESHKEIMNSLNVFPVPDADTGTNMYISIKGILDSLGDNFSYDDFEHLSKNVADFALLSAQGNSGLLIAQLFRGIHKGVSKSNTLGLNELASSLQQTYEYAYDSIINPQEGTMLTVMRECAKIANEYARAKNSNFEDTFKAISFRAKSAVEETKDQMDLLKEADVIDSGAYGFSIMLEAAKNCIESDDQGNINLRLDGTNSFIPEIPTDLSLDENFFLTSFHEENWGYCTVFAITGDDLNIENIKKNLSDKGRSLVVSGSDRVCKIHIHTEEPDMILNLSKKFGEISNENITNMDEQFKEMKEKISSKVSSEISLLVTTEGLGINNFLENNTFGSINIVSNSEFEKMDYKKFVLMLDNMSSNKIILISNSESSYIKFKDFSHKFRLPITTNTRLHLLKSINDSQLVSAVFSFSPEQDLENNLISMKSAIDNNNCIEIDSMHFSDRNSLHKELKNSNLNADFVSIFYSESSTEEQISMLKDILEKEFNINDTEFISHSSKIYDYLLSIE